MFSRKDFFKDNLEKKKSKRGQIRLSDKNSMKTKIPILKIHLYCFLPFSFVKLFLFSEREKATRFEHVF